MCMYMYETVRGNERGVPPCELRGSQRLQAVSYGWEGEGEATPIQTDRSGDPLRRREVRAAQVGVGGGRCSTRLSP